jgi:predicted ATPase/class 3 adenylate cyclase
MDERAQIEAAIAALEAQRSNLGDAVVDAAVASMRARMDEPEALPRAATRSQQLDHVTILFVDVVGSTAMSGLLDPEDIVEVIDTALARFTAAVQAQRGKVLQFTGDGLLAVFGGDAADEQGAESAVHAGLAIIAQAQQLAAEVAAKYGVQGFNVRAGIDSGQVLLGAGVDAENSIRGSAVNLAARMEQSAPVGGLRISHNTYRQIRGVFDVAEQPAIAVKGVDPPVRSYLVHRAKPRAFRVGSRGIEGIETRMVGRDAQLAQLQAAFMSLQHADHASRPRSVTVVSDAGVGKSRLMYEFENWAEARPETFRLFKGRAQPQTRQQPYGLMRDLLAWRFQIADSDGAELARQKFSAGLSPLLADAAGEADEAGDEAVHLLGHLIGFDFSTSPHLRGILGDPQQIRGRAFHAGARMFRRNASGAATPSVILLDDIQWADEGSLDFIHHLIGMGRESALLVIAFTRPLLFEHRPDWGRHEPHAMRIPLAPLGAEQRLALTDELLQELDDVPEGLRELITGNGDGNPFFMEEIVKMLLDEGAIVPTDTGRWRVSAERLRAARVPTTLAGVLQSRLAVLRTEERIALQQASVVGFIFWDQALAALDKESPHALDRLAGREFVVAQRSSAFEGAREFTFQHHLMHQFAYESLLKRDRRVYHARAAAWLAELASERGTEYLSATAEHHERAGQLVEATSYYARAAESAAARDARGPALGHVGRALALVAATDHETRWRLIATRERLLANQKETTQRAADLDTLALLADALDDDTRRAEALLRRATACIDQGDYPQAYAVAQQALPFARRAGDTDAVGRLCGKLALASRRMGDFATAQRHAQVGLDLVRPLGKRSTELALLRSLAPILNEGGDLLAGQALSMSCVTISREIGDRGTEVGALNDLADSCIRLGDYDPAGRYLAEALKLAEQLGRPDIQSLAGINRAAVAHLLGEHAQAVMHAQAAVEIAVALDARDLEAAALLHQGLAEAALRHDDAARAALSRSRDLFELNAGPHLALEPTAGLARLLLAQGRTAEAVTEIEKILGHLAAGGRLDGTEEPFRIRLSCHEVLSRAGDERADTVLADAHAELQAHALRLVDAATRRQFLHDVPHHRAISEAWAERAGSLE